MKKVFVFLLSAAAVLAACTKTSETATRLEVDATEITVGDNPEVAQLTVTADGPWKMEISEDWVVASRLSGSGTAKVKFAVMKNADYSSREAVATVRSGNLSKEVKLVQAQKNWIAVDDTSIDLGYDAGEYTLTLQTNVPLQAESSADWLTVVSTKGLVDETYTLSYSLNPGRESRLAQVRFTGGGQEIDVTLEQDAFEPSFALEDEMEVGPWGTLSAPKEGLSYQFKVVSNMDFTASAPDADWIHVAVEGDVVTVTVDENTGAARSEYLYMGCSKEDVDYSDYGAMIKVAQKGQAQAVELWKHDFYWDIFPQSTRVSLAVAGDYFVLYSPNAITPGFHVMKREDGTEVSVAASPLENVTGITNDDAGNVIVTTGGNYPLDESVTQIPLKVYVLTEEEFLSGTVGEPIITYMDGFYGYGLDNARVTGNAKGNAVLAMTSGCGGGGSYVVAWDIKDGAATNDPTIYASCASIGGDLWDSFHGVSLGAGTSSAGGFYFAGYLGDYNLHYTAQGGDATSWSVVFPTGYTWEGAINAGDVFTCDGHKYLAVLGMNYFAYSDWGLNPCNLWVFNVDDPAAPVLMINQEYRANEENWQYGSNTDIQVVMEEGVPMAYLLDAAASTYRKLEIQL